MLTLDIVRRLCLPENILTLTLFVFSQVLDVQIPTSTNIILAINEMEMNHMQVSVVAVVLMGVGWVVGAEMCWY